MENLSTMEGHIKSLQDQLKSSQASLEEAVQQKDSLVNDIKCLREELQQVRNDRDASLEEAVKQKDSLVNDIKCLREELQQVRIDRDRLRSLTLAYKAELDRVIMIRDLSLIECENIAVKFDVLEETCSSQSEQIRVLELQITEGEKLRKKLHNTILELKGNIRVFCRVRPWLPVDGVGAEEATVVSYPTSTEALGRGVDLLHNGQNNSFTFDKVFNHEASQHEVFVEISELVQSALDGYKVCLFAYGQIGSGKTYTMMGRPEAPEQKGLIPRSLEQIFQASQSLQSQGWKYKMQVSMLEIYNETIRDLLSTHQSSGSDITRTENSVFSKQYAINHDANGNTHVSGLTIVDVRSIGEISSLLQQAAHNRSVGKTQMNEQSSRSHFVFTLRISGVNENTEQQVQGVLNLIDLAGSQRLSGSEATGDRLKETQAINKSLFCLRDVILSLAKKDDHVPFRNSMLTYLLQPCLGGGSKTLMFVNMSPDPSSAHESLCSLEFATKVNACEIGLPRRQTTM